MPQNNFQRNRPKHHNSESGNVFLFILLGVVLFGALSFSIARGFRTDTTSAMSARQAELAASDIINFANRIERAVSRVRRKGISENDISFDTPALTGYNHTPAAPDNAKIFNPNGGAINYAAPQSGVNDASAWHFTARTCVSGIGSGAAGCNSDTDASNEDLLIVLNNVNALVCEEINDALNITDIPTDAGGGASTTKFQGTFSDNTIISLPGGPFNTACFTNGTSNTFYSVIFAR